MEDLRTLRFLIFAAVGVLSLTAGYYARKKNLVGEDFSHKVHFHTVLWVWTVGGVISLWIMKPHAQQWWLFLIVPAAMAASVWGMVWAARRLGVGRSQTGALAVGAGIGNTGSTMTAYLAYLLIEPHEQALAYASAACYMMLFMAVAMVYPVAQANAGPDAQGSYGIKQVLKSYVDVRSIGLWSCVVGLMLALFKVPVPSQIHDWHVLDAVAFMAAVGGYLGIGLKLRFGEWRVYMREHVLMAVVKFVVSPLVTLGIILLIGLFFKPLPRMETAVLMLASAAPAGISLVIVANLFQLDSRMASIVWLFNTAMYLVVVFPICWVLLRVFG
jgi:predicted permease